MSDRTPISRELSSKISNMSFVCACLVISMHIWLHPTSGIAGILDKMFYGGISKIAVPTFFCISGYLIAPKIAAGNYKREITKRFRTLVIPFYFWR